MSSVNSIEPRKLRLADIRFPAILFMRDQGAGEEQWLAAIHGEGDEDSAREIDLNGHRAQWAIQVRWRRSRPSSVNSIEPRKLRSADIRLPAILFVRDHGAGEEQWLAAIHGEGDEDSAREIDLNGHRAQWAIQVRWRRSRPA